MAEAYLNDQKRILPCAAYVNGEYGVTDLCRRAGDDRRGRRRKGCRDRAGRRGQSNLQVSVDAVKELLVACKGIEPSLA
jgi:malate dehydrogenase